VSVSGPPRAVVFDFNGTISDDEPLLAELFVQIFGEIGIEVTEKRYWGEFAGYSDPEIVERMLSETGRHDPPVARRLLDRRAELYLARAAGGETVHPEVATCVREIADRVPVAVASGAVRAEVEAVLEGSGLLPLLATVVTADDVTQGKPDPEGYLIALDRLGIPGADALSFEDTHFGVMAAVAAGMRCVGVGTTVSAERLRDAGAESVVASLDWSIPTVRGLFA
jgi:beta-phosphoglucomutase-like phosphatase (HAD superfamily)